MSAQATALCLRLQGETLARIRADRLRVPVKVAALLAKIEEHLLDSNLTVEALMRWCGQQDKNVSTRFAEHLGLTPAAYILQARMELAGRMLADSTLKVWQIGLEVGYDSGHSFGRAFKRWSGGQTPTEFRRRARAAEGAREEGSPPAELVRNVELHQALAGDLPVEAAGALTTRLRDLAGQISDVYQTACPPAGGRAPGPPTPEPHAIEPVMARNLWRWIENLPWEVQRAAILSQAPAFHTPALFHVLCTESIEAGAEDDLRGQMIAALALDCLPAIAERLGEDSRYVFARAYAVVGLAFRRSGDLDEAASNLGISYRILKSMGDEAHPVVVAELCLYQAMLELDRDDVEMAERLSNQGFKILETLFKRLLGQLPEQDDETPGGGVEPCP